MSREDWDAVISSEVFRIYAKNMLETEKRNKLAEAEKQEELINKFEELQENINKSPALKKAFLTIQKRLMADPEFAKKVDAAFVSGVLLLNIEEN